MKTISLFLLSLFIVFGVHAQHKYAIKGQVKDQKSQAALPFVNVFLEGTTIGTQTDENGNYTIKNAPLGKYQLVASMVGYLHKTQSLTVLDKNLTFDFLLTEDAKALDEVKITTNRDKVWEKNYKDFEREFLGSTANFKKVRILNKEVLDFTDENDTLKASASVPLEIENEVLGYHISYILQNFISCKKTTAYKGLARFTLIDAQAENANWDKNRLDAYKGSERHFLKALIDNKLTEEGFDAYYLNPKYVQIPNTRILFYDIYNKRHLLISQPELVTKSMVAGIYNLNWKLPIEVVYNKGYSLEKKFADVSGPVTVLTPKTNNIMVFADGTLLDPYTIEQSGNMSKARMAGLLPSNFEPSSIAQSPNQEKSAATNAKVDEIEQKIFLHTDKSVYFANDSLWYKAYVVDASNNQLVDDIQKIFVELAPIDSSKKIIYQQVLKSTDNGLAWSKIVLPDTLTSGKYILRAYTNWMRNVNNAVVFQKEIIFKNLYKSSKTSPNVSKPNTEVQFFPEGGQYLEGVPSRFGVKLGTNEFAEAVVYDQNDQVITKFYTNEMGIGSFSFNSASNAKVVIQDKTYKLPDAIKDGLSLRIDSSGIDTLAVHIYSSKINTKAQLLIQSKGIVYQNLDLTLNKKHLKVLLPTEGFRKGIFQFTLFDQNGLPQCERLLFIASDAPEADIELAQNSVNDKVSLSLSLKSDNADTEGEFSMSIADASQVAFSDNAENIKTYLLLSSEVKGKIENPNFYFKSNTQYNKKALDDLLLTQGWRKYNWQDISKNLASSQYKAFEPFSFTGQLTTKSKKTEVLANTNLTILPRTKELQLINCKTNSKGQFFLENIDFHDSTSFVFKIANEKNKDLNGIITLAETQPVSLFSDNSYSPISLRLDNSFLQAGSQRKSNENLFIHQGQLLKEVNVKSKKIVNFDTYSNGMPIWKIYDKPDGYIEITEHTNGSNIIEVIRGKIPAFRIKGSGTTVSPYEYSFRGGDTSGVPLFLLDGIYFNAPKLDTDPLMEINVRDIERIDYLTDQAPVYGVRAAGGVIAIYTKRGSDSQDNGYTRLQVQKLKGFESFKEFYVEKPQIIQENIPDLRDVLLWKPSFSLNTSETSTFDCYLNSVATKLLVTIEGLVDGNPVSVLKVINVKK